VAEGQELAQAVVRFVGEDSGYQATKAQVLASSRQLTSEISSQGAAATSAAGIVDQYGRAVSTVGEAETRTAGATKAAADAVRGAVIPTKDLVPELKKLELGHASSGKETLEHAKALRSLAVALLSEAVPGLRIGSREVQLLGREFGGSSALSTGLALGMGALAVVAGIYVGQQLELNKALQAAEFAKLTEDVNASRAALAAADRAVSDTATNYEIWAGHIEHVSLAQRLIAGVMVTVDGVMGTTNQKVREAIELNTGYLGKLAATTSALNAEKAALEGQAATLGIERQRVATLEQLLPLYAREADGILRMGEINAQRVVDEGKLAAAVFLRLSRETTDEEEAKQLKVRAQQTVADAAIVAGSIREKAAAAAAAQEMTAAKAVTAALVAVYEQQGRMAGIQGAAQLDAAKTGAALVEAAHKAAAADAQFFGESEAGLAAYQQKRRASIEETAALEIATLTRVLEAERARQTVTINDPNAGPEGRRAALNALTAAEAKYAADVQAISGRTAVALADDATKVTEERRAANARAASDAASYYQHLAALDQADYGRHLALLVAKGRDENLSDQQRLQFQEQAFAMYGQLIAKAAGYYQQLASLGQVSAAQQIGFLDQQSTNEKLSVDQRIGYAVEAAGQRRALEQATFDLSQALGLTNAADAVAHARTIADSYVEGSTARIAAETQWATAVMQLQTQVAAVGRQFSTQAIDALKAQGQEEVSLASITAQSATSRAAALATLTEFLKGNTVNAGELKKALDLSASFAALTASGQTAGDAIKTDFTLARDALAGVPRTAADAASSLTGIGGAARGVDASVNTATGNIVNQLNRIDVATDRVEVSFNDAGAAASRGFRDGLTRGLDGSLSAVDSFYGQLQAKIDAGNSRIGDSIYEGLINRIVGALDAEANRS